MAGSIRARATSAVAKLKQHGDHDEAAAIESLLGPGGYKLLQRTETREPSPLSLTIPVTLKQALVEAADEFDVVLDALAEEAYSKVLAGEWLPPHALGYKRGAGAKTTLQVFVDSGLRHEVQGRLGELTDQAGFKVTETSIALLYVCAELGVEQPNPGSNEAPEMRFPKSLVQHWKDRADAEGLTLEGIAADGIRELLEGKWVPERNRYFTDRKAILEGRKEQRSWSESQRARLYVPLEKDLLAALRVKTQELSDELGYLVSPGTVIRAVLTDRLGEPAE
ncbi:hypothetical protein [Streptomyces sp. NPDC003395]